MRFNIGRPATLFSSSRMISLLLLGFVALEFALLTSWFDLGQWSVDKGDEPGYQLLATNILDHGTLSLSEQAPFEPSVLRAPGYPLFVAAAYVVSGRSPMFLRLIQFLLLGLTGILLYRLAKPLVGPNISGLAGAFCVIYPPFVFQAAYHLTETLATLLALLVVYLTLLMMTRAAHRRLLGLALGLAAGSAALVRPSLALLVAVPILVLLWSGLRNAALRKQAVLIGIVSAGYIVLIVPCAMRNATVARAFLPFGSAGGWSFCYSLRQYAGEASYRMPLEEWGRIIREYDLRQATAHAALSVAPIPDGASTAALADVLVDESYSRDAWDLWHNLPITRVIAGIPVRLMFLWSTADTSPWAAAGRFHRLIQLLHIGIVILVLGGCYLMRGEIIRYWPLWIVPLYLVLVHLVFHVEPRYSFPGRPFLFVFAAIACERFVSFARSFRRVRGISQASGSAEAAL